MTSQLLKGDLRQASLLIVVSSFGTMVAGAFLGSQLNWIGFVLASIFAPGLLLGLAKFLAWTLHTDVSPALPEKAFMKIFGLRRPPE